MKAQMSRSPVSGSKERPPSSQEKAKEEEDDDDDGDDKKALRIKSRADASTNNRLPCQKERQVYAYTTLALLHPKRGKVFRKKEVHFKVVEQVDEEKAKVRLPLGRPIRVANNDRIRVGLSNKRSSQAHRNESSVCGGCENGLMSPKPPSPFPSRMK